MHAFSETACNQGTKKGFLSGEQEPWVFRGKFVFIIFFFYTSWFVIPKFSPLISGGLAADLQRLLPLETANDLFLYKTPETPTRQVYTIRPYLSADSEMLYALCRKLYVARFSDESHELEMALDSYPNLIGDMYVAWTDLKMRRSQSNGNLFLVNQQFCWCLRNFVPRVVLRRWGW